MRGVHDPDCNCDDCIQKRFDATYRQPHQDIFGGHQTKPINFGLWGTIAALVAVVLIFVGIVVIGSRG